MSQNQSTKDSESMIGCLFILIIGFLIFKGCDSCTSSDPEYPHDTQIGLQKTEAIDTRNYSEGFKLLSIDKGHRDHSHTEIEQYDSLVQSIREYCSDSEKEIGEKVYKASLMIKERNGKDYNNLFILNFAQSMLKEADLYHEKGCTEVFTLIVMTLGS